MNANYITDQVRCELTRRENPIAIFFGPPMFAGADRASIGVTGIADEVDKATLTDVAARLMVFADKMAAFANAMSDAPEVKP